MTYSELWSDILAVSRGLAALGVRQFDRIGIYLEKRIETVVSIFASSVARAVFVPINPLMRPRQVQHILTDCDVRVLVTSSERLSGLRSLLDECKALEYVIVVGDDVHPCGGRKEVVSWTEVARDSGHVGHDPGVDLDMAAILYTSGSTGKPKGVVLSHRNLVAGAESVSSYLHNNADDVILAVLPLSFDAGLSQLTTGFCVGAHAVLMNHLMPGDVVRLCGKHGVTGLTCVPPLWIQLADQVWPDEAVEKLRYFASTGGRMPKATLERLRALFPHAAPYLMYGLTEAFRSTYLDPSEVDNRPSSIGKAVPNAEILVVRPDGMECEPGEEGELVHRGPLVALGYWNDPERTAMRFRPAPGRPGGLSGEEIAVWSGDTVVRDSEGFLYFVGRKDDMIKSSGYRVSPTEIEEAAYDTGLVGNAVAVGVEDSRLGQRIGLGVTPVAEAELDVDVLIKLMAGQLPRYMVPKRVVIYDELPRMPNGKFDRGAVRRRLAGGESA